MRASRGPWPDWPDVEPSGGVLPPPAPSSSSSCSSYVSSVTCRPLPQLTWHPQSVRMGPRPSGQLRSVQFRTAPRSVIFSIAKEGVQGPTGDHLPAVKPLTFLPLRQFASRRTRTNAGGRRSCASFLRPGLLYRATVQNLTSLLTCVPWRWELSLHARSRCTLLPHHRCRTRGRPSTARAHFDALGLAAKRATFAPARAPPRLRSGGTIPLGPPRAADRLRA